MSNSYCDWKGWVQAEFGQFSLEDNLYFEKELKVSGITSVRGLKVGEIGFGNGTFAGWVKSKGGDWVGKEVSPELLDRARRASFNVLSNDAGFSHGSGSGVLDVLVGFDVLEHMELLAIREFLRDAKSALRVGGYLLLRLPSGDSPLAGVVFHGDVTHRTLLGSSAIRQLAVEVGLVVSQIRSPSLPIFGLGSFRALRRVVASIARAMTFAFIRSMLIGNSSAVLSSNMFVVLRKADPTP